MTENGGRNKTPNEHHPSGLIGLPANCSLHKTTQKSADGVKHTEPEELIAVKQKTLDIVNKIEPPKPGYTCLKCKQGGHLLQHCPNVSVSKTLPCDVKVAKGACDNCGSLKHKTKTCVERPRSKKRKTS